MDTKSDSMKIEEKLNKKRVSRRTFLYGAAAAGVMAVQGRLNAHGAQLPPVHAVTAGTKHATTPIIDVHRHCMWKPGSSEDKVMEKFFKMKTHWQNLPTGDTLTVDGITSIVYPELSDIDVQVQKQDEAGVTLGILSFSMELELLCRELSLAPDDLLTRMVNDKTAALAAKYPGKLAFMAMVNPATEGATAECERCLNKLGAKGINLSTSWQGEYLDSEKINPFWKYVEHKDVAVYLHPPFIPLGYQKMDCYRLEEVVGRPFDTTMTIARMIYSGVFDWYPKLKIVLPHMGGGLPGVIGRLDFGYRLGYGGLPQGQAAICKRKPSDYLRTNLYVDTMGFSPAGIRHCIELFGIDRILFGTDYAAVNISPREHIDIVKGLGLSKQAEAKIFFENANHLFRLL